MGGNVLKNRNYLLLFLGGVVSNLGSQVFNFAISYYIYEIASPTIAGIYLATGGLVYFVISPFAGAIVDRLDKVKVVWMTDYIRGIAVVIAGLVIFSGVNLTITLIVLFTTTVILGINGALFNPAASSLPPHILEENQLQQSSSLTQGMFALYMILGSIIGGAIYSFLNIEWIFIINGVSFILSGFSEMFIQLKTQLEKVRMSFVSIVVDIKDGFFYLLKLKPILMLVVVASLMNFFTAPALVNGLPYLFAVELKAEPIYLSILISFYPVGIIITSVVLGSVAQKKRVSGIIIKGLYGMAVFFSVFVVATNFVVGGKISFWMFMVVSCSAILIIGVFNGMVNIPFNVAIMKTVEKNMLGRVSSVINTISNGLSPIAIGLAGVSIDNFGIMSIFYVAGISLFITGILASSNKHIKKL
jgi:MFS transporter, DHA3 family, macrolide efflux protein